MSHNLDEILENEEFPAICPFCHHREAHLYLRGDTQRPYRGGMWLWCSNCGASEHGSIQMPSYWENDSFTDPEKLTTSYLEHHKHKIDSYINENYKGLNYDPCASCIRFQDFSDALCPNCRSKGAVIRLEGHTLIAKCPNCGYEVAGASFYAPCEKDNRTYHIKINSKNLPAPQILSISRTLHLNAQTTSQTITSGLPLPTALHLGDLIKAEQLLNSHQIKYSTIPPHYYSNLHQCPRKLLPLHL